VQLAGADLCITPDLSGFNLIDTSQIADIIPQGYKAAIPLLGAWKG
ncbi:MAG: patatin, partial [Chlorobium limicola]|nr:patatin [Chlorobium limicola]